MNAFLTNYSVSTGDAVFRRWQELAEAILTKHVDGYMKDSKRPPQGRRLLEGMAPRGRRSHGPTSSSSPRTARPSRPITDQRRTHLLSQFWDLKNPRLPGENFQYVEPARRRERESGDRGEHRKAWESSGFRPVFLQSGFQPTVEPTGFQPVVVQL